MLVHFTEFLKEASQQRYAVGSFNGYNYETFQGIIAAGQEMQAPIILAFGAKYLQNMSFKEASALARLFAADSPDSVCLHLDHCSELATVFQAIQSGFNSVMYDGSALSFGENVTNTKLVCDVAHACGVSVEAELGSIAAGAFSHEGSELDREIFTDPMMAAEFVAATGVDALAVSIGTVHGMYTAKPQLRFDILAEIQQLVSVPLVLHGGSGLSEVDISRCIAGGIA
ncbi:MAG: class II fructose-bisphosphate aldolase, partial [Sporomusaceae bacterium]|nr:class II fructose-bisphosphate aldolase [Sporomusaceae bacterium]